jgi:hypothetical protein
MAHYLVTAKPKSDRLGDLLANLRKKVYAAMRPFGKTLTYSLQSARLRADGYATWEEEDYCSPPLAEERAAQPAPSARESLRPRRPICLLPAIRPGADARVTA